MAEHNNKVNTEESTENTIEKMGCNETAAECSESKNVVDDVTKKMAETELMEPQEYKKEKYRQIAEKMAELKAKGKKMVEVKKFHGVAFWSWNIDADNCAICRNHIMDPCIECQAQKDNTKDCICASGQCSHAFHFHCVQRWLKTRNVCPMCNQEWEYENFESKCI